MTTTTAVAMAFVPSAVPAGFIGPSGSIKLVCSRNAPTPRPSCPRCDVSRSARRGDEAWLFSASPKTSTRSLKVHSRFLRHRIYRHRIYHQRETRQRVIRQRQPRQREAQCN